MPWNLNAPSARWLCARWNDGPSFTPIRGRPPCLEESEASRPMALLGCGHVPVSRQKRFRAKTVRALFRCRSAGTITTITADNGVGTALFIRGLRAVWTTKGPAAAALEDARVLRRFLCLHFQFCRTASCVPQQNEGVEELRLIS